MGLQFGFRAMGLSSSLIGFDWVDAGGGFAADAASGAHLTAVKWLDVLFAEELATSDTLMRAIAT
jgi:hypothetical protein